MFELSIPAMALLIVMMATSFFDRREQRKLRERVHWLERDRERITEKLEDVTAELRHHHDALTESGRRALPRPDPLAMSPGRRVCDHCGKEFNKDPDKFYKFCSYECYADNKWPKSDNPNAGYQRPLDTPLEDREPTGVGADGSPVAVSFSWEES